VKKFLILLKKEIKELLTLQTILPLVITAGLFMFIGNIVSKEAEKTNKPQDVVLINQDNSTLSSFVVENLTKANVNVSLSTENDINKAISDARGSNKSAILIIPSGFEQAILSGNQKKIDVYTVINNFSISGSKNYTNLLAAFAVTNETLSNSLIKQKIVDINPNVIKNPLAQNEFIVVGDKKANASPNEIMGFVSQQTMFIPIILFFVIVFASQMIATAVANEKENKTLETLLTTPVSRKAIVAAKMMGAGVVALLASVIYIFGFKSYIGGITGGQKATEQTSQIISSLGLSLNTNSYILLGLSLFAGILVALAISLILGAFAEDVKGVAGLTTPLMIIVAIPYFLTMFTDINSLSPAMRYLVYAIPFSHIFMAAPNLFLHNYAPVIWGIVYQLIVFGLFVWIAAWIFSTDKIITMKLNFSKMRKFNKNR